MRISQPFASILLAMPSIILLGDLLFVLAPNDSFIRELTYLGISTTLMQMITTASPFVFYLAAVKIIILLLTPVFVIIFIIATAVSDTKYRNGMFKQRYEESFINCTLRSFLATYILFFLPLFISLGVKFMQLGTNQAILGAIILVLACFDCLIIEYHTF